MKVAWKISLVLLVGLAVGLSVYWYSHLDSISGSREQVPGYRVAPSPDGDDDANPRSVSSSVAIDLFRKNLKQLLSNDLEWKRIRDRYRKNGALTFRAEEMRRREENLTFERLLHQALRESDEARKELLALVRSESDPETKRTLGRLFHDLDPAILEPIETDLARSESAEDRKVAMEGLGMIRNERVLKTLLYHAEQDSSMEVRQEAVGSIGRTANSIRPDELPAQKVAQESLRSLALSSPPELRDTLFRTISTQINVSEADRQLIREALQKETDPKRRQALTFYDHALSARLRSNSSRATGASRTDLRSE
jgi:hypothetical protein